MLRFTHIYLLLFAVAQLTQSAFLGEVVFVQGSCVAIGLYGGGVYRLLTWSDCDAVHSP